MNHTVLSWITSLAGISTQSDTIQKSAPPTREKYLDVCDKNALPNGFPVLFFRFANQDSALDRLIRNRGVFRLFGGCAIGAPFWKDSGPRYSPIVLTIIFLGSINLICLGIVGSYVWRVYENTRQNANGITHNQCHNSDV